MPAALFTVPEAAAYLKLDQEGLTRPREAVRWLYRTGKLKYTKVGRYVRFRKAWLDALINRNAVQRNSRNRHTATPKARRK